MGACNCDTWFCRLDTALHALGIKVRRVCDRHDRYILDER